MNNEKHFAFECVWFFDAGEGGLSCRFKKGDGVSSIYIYICESDSKN